MIKLTILSGIVLSKAVDIYNRTPLHYASWNDIKHNYIFEVLIKCYSLQLGNKQDDLIKFISKAFTTIKEENNDILSEGEVSSMLEEMNAYKSGKEIENENRTKKIKSFKEALNLQDIDSRSILHYACINNNLEMIKIILGYSAIPEDKDFENNVNKFNKFLSVR